MLISTPRSRAIAGQCRSMQSGAAVCVRTLSELQWCVYYESSPVTFSTECTLSAGYQCFFLFIDF